MKAVLEPFTDEPGYSLLGWPQEDECMHCGARAAMLVATYDSATYECRGTPEDPSRSVYGPDRCARVYTRSRA